MKKVKKMFGGGMGLPAQPKPAPMPMAGTRPPGILGTTGGPKPAPVVQQPSDLRPRGTPTTGGPKPAPAGMTGLGSAAQNNPRMMGNLGALGAGLGKRMGMKEGGSVSSASKRADGCAVKGKTKGKMV
jgi:hypothetical protein